MCLSAGKSDFNVGAGRVQQLDTEHMAPLLLKATLGPEGPLLLFLFLLSPPPPPPFLELLPPLRRRLRLPLRSRRSPLLVRHRRSG